MPWPSIEVTGGRPLLPHTRPQPAQQHHHHQIPHHCPSFIKLPEPGQWPRQKNQVQVITLRRVELEAAILVLLLGRHPTIHVSPLLVDLDAVRRLGVSIDGGRLHRVAAVRMADSRVGKNEAVWATRLGHGLR